MKLVGVRLASNNGGVWTKWGRKETSTLLNGGFDSPPPPPIK